jgi:hypothetical protein
MKQLRAVSARVKYGAAIAVVAAVSAGCGSSAKGPAGAAGPASPASSAGSTGSTGSTAPTGSASASTRTVALPAPCTLLTIADVEPLFGTTALQSTPTTGPVRGVSGCTFTLSAGVQAKTVSVRTHTDFPDDPSYVFPSQGTTPVPGLGYPAVLQSTNNHASNTVNQSTLTVKLGTNALEIHVEWYTDPVNNTFVTQLTKQALTRL